MDDLAFVVVAGVVAAVACEAVAVVGDAFASAMIVDDLDVANENAL